MAVFNGKKTSSASTARVPQTRKTGPATRKTQIGSATSPVNSSCSIELSLFAAHPRFPQLSDYQKFTLSLYLILLQLPYHI